MDIVRQLIDRLVGGTARVAPDTQEAEASASAIAPAPEQETLERAEEVPIEPPKPCDSPDTGELVPGETVTTAPDEPETAVVAPENEPATCEAAPEPTRSLNRPALQNHRFDVRNFQLVRYGNDELEWEDAFAHDERSGTFAIADGASAGIFVKAWARILTESYVSTQMDLGDTSNREAWLRDCLREWRAGFDYPSLRWTQQVKVDDVGGAATFLSLEFRERTETADDSAPVTSVTWQSWAVGDCCLFHLRDGQLLSSFPLTRAEEFGSAPPLLRSKLAAGIPEPVRAEGEARPGDLFVLATDAVAQALLAQALDGEGPLDWDGLVQLETEAWREMIATWRAEGRIVNDDATMLAVRILTR